MAIEFEGELVLDVQAPLGEGAIWHAPKQLLYWVDIEGQKVHLFDPASREDRAIDVGQKVGTVVPRARGGAMVALRDGFAALDLDDGTLTLIADPEAHLENNRFNDGKCDPSGRFWAGTYGKAPGGLYRLDRDLSVRKMLGGIGCSNGIAWSQDRRTMYYIDTTRSEVWSFDYDDVSGDIANQRVLARVPKEQGFPDGSTLDAEGNLWVALWGGWGVIRIDTGTGEQTGVIRVPASQVTSCAFGGPNLDTLYITSARAFLSEEELEKQPHAGGLFAVKPGVLGVPCVEFAG